MHSSILPIRSHNHFGLLSSYFEEFFTVFSFHNLVQMNRYIKAGNKTGVFPNHKPSSSGHYVFQAMFFFNAFYLLVHKLLAVDQIQIQVKEKP